MTPLTLDVTTRRAVAGGKRVTTRQSVLRTVDRVHISVQGGREWLFERNTIDRARVSGVMIDHSSRSVVLFEESELRNLQGIRGWVDVITMGIDLPALAQVRASTKRRSVLGIEFARHAPTSPDVALRDLWWSAEQLLPRSYTARSSGGSLQFRVRLRRGVDDRKLAHPRSRFPDYRVLDVADWLEQR